MKRVAILSLVAVVFALAPAAPVNAHRPYWCGDAGPVRRICGRTSACGEKCAGLTAGTNLYVGWMDDPKGVNAKFTPENLSFLAEPNQARVPDKGPVARPDPIRSTER